MSDAPDDGAAKRRQYKRRYAAAKRREINNLDDAVLDAARRAALTAGDLAAARKLEVHANNLLYRAQRQPAPAPYTSWMQ